MKRNNPQQSKKGIVIVAAAVVAIATVGFFVKGTGGSHKEKGEGEIIATVNGKPVYSSEAEAQLGALLKGQKGADQASYEKLDEKAKFIVIKELAAQQLILEDAYNKDADDSDNVKQKLDEYKDKLVKEEFLTSMAKNAVTEEKIKARYDELTKELQGKTQYKLRHILVKSEAAAESAIKSLEESSFDDVAKKKSLDEGTSLTGGDLGYMLGGSMLKEFEDAVVKMKDGEVSKPVKTKFGWHVIKLEGKRAAVADPYESVKAKLAQEMFGETIQTYVKDLVDKSKIELVASAKTEEAPAATAEEKAAAPAANVEAPAAVEAPTAPVEDAAPAAASEEGKE